MRIMKKEKILQSEFKAHSQMKVDPTKAVKNILKIWEKNIDKTVKIYWTYNSNNKNIKMKIMKIFLYHRELR